MSLKSNWAYTLFILFTLPLAGCDNTDHNKTDHNKTDHNTTQQTNINHTMKNPIIEIIDSRGKVQFTRVPKNVISINLTLTEQLLDLDIAPVAIADADFFRHQSGRPALPDSVADIGTRDKPDLARIKALSPDVILLGHAQKHLIRTMQNIAPVIYFKNFSHRYDNAAKAQEIYLKLATLFEKDTLAEARLLEMESSIRAMKKSVMNASLKSVAVIQHDDTGTDVYWGFTENSPVDHAIKHIGLKNAINRDATKFGFERIDLDTLAIENLCLLYVNVDAPRTESRHNINTPCFATLPAMSFYGGALSVGRLATAIGQATLEALSKVPSKAMP